MSIRRVDHRAIRFYGPSLAQLVFSASSEMAQTWNLEPGEDELDEYEAACFYLDELVGAHVMRYHGNQLNQYTITVDSGATSHREEMAFRVLRELGVDETAVIWVRP